MNTAKLEKIINKVTAGKNFSGIISINKNNETIYHGAF